MFHPVFLMALYLLLIAGPVMAGWGLYDALRHTAGEWDGIRQVRWMWIVLLVIALSGGPFMILSIYYWARVSPQLKAAQAAG